MTGMGVCGVGHVDQPRSEHPLSTVTMTRTWTHVYPSHYVTADEAREVRIKRLREARIKHTVTEGVVEYVDHDGTHVRLEWADTANPEIVPTTTQVAR